MEADAPGPMPDEVQVQPADVTGEEPPKKERTPAGDAAAVEGGRSGPPSTGGDRARSPRPSSRDRERSTRGRDRDEGKERSRRRSNSRGRDGDRDRNPDRHRDRSRSRERRRRDDRRRSRSDSRSRRRGGSGDKDTRRRSRSRSRDRRRRSRSRSRGRGGSDALHYSRPAADLGVPRMLPGMGAPLLPGAAHMLPGLPQFPNMPNMMMAGLGNPMMPNMPFPNMPNMPHHGGMGQVHLAGPNQATRTQRRLYMGGLPSPCYDFQLVEFFNSTLLALGLVPPSGRPPVIKCDINAARGFAFVEFLEVADCTAALQLDGIIYNGAQINIKRPKDYAMPFGSFDPPPLGPVAIAALLAQKTGIPPGALAGFPPPPMPEAAPPPLPPMPMPTPPVEPEQPQPPPAEHAGGWP